MNWATVGLHNKRLYVETWMLTTYWNWNVRFRNPTAQSRFGWSLNDSQNNPMKPVYNDSISPGRLPIPTKIKDILSHWQYNHCRFLDQVCVCGLQLFLGDIYIGVGKSHGLLRPDYN